MEAALNGPQGRVTLGPEQLRLGRAPDNSLVVSDPQSSSHHAEITPGPDGASYVLTDLGSTNGTFVNEQRLAPHAPQTLRAGDVIRIGNTPYSYEVTGAIDATVRASGPSVSGPGYEPTVYAGPPSSPAPSYGATTDSYGVPPSYGTPPQPDYAPQPPAYTPDGIPGAYPPPPSGYPIQQPGYPAAPSGYPATPGYPSAQPGLGGIPGGMGTPGFQPPPQKSKAGLWTGIIIALVLVVGGGIFGVVYANRSTPEKTMAAVCIAFKNADGQAFYDQLSTQAKATTTPAKLKQDFSLIAAAGGVKTCTYSNVREDDDTATVTMNLVFNDSQLNSGNGDLDTKLINENGTWKLNEDMGTDSSSNV